VGGFQLEQVGHGGISLQSNLPFLLFFYICFFLLCHLCSAGRQKVIPDGHGWGDFFLVFFSARSLGIGVLWEKRRKHPSSFQTTYRRYSTMPSFLFLFLQKGIKNIMDTFKGGRVERGMERSGGRREAGGRGRGGRSRGRGEGGGEGWLRGGGVDGEEGGARGRGGGGGSHGGVLDAHVHLQRALGPIRLVTVGGTTLEPSLYLCRRPPVSFLLTRWAVCITFGGGCGGGGGGG
jgi:hypothetical protein